MNVKLKTLGLALVLSLIFATASGSAQAAAHWNVGGSALASGSSEALAETVNLTKLGTETTPTAVFTMEGLTRIACTGLSVNKGFILGTSSGRANFLSFTGCVVKNTKGETDPRCIIKSEGGAAGTIKTTAFESALKEVSGKIYDIFTPASGTVITTVVLSAVEGGSCGLSGTNKWTGSTSFELPVGTNSTTLEVSSSAAISTAAGTAIKYGERSLVLDLGGGIQLVGGKTFGVGL